MSIRQFASASPGELEFKYPGDRVIHLAVPNDFEIVKTGMVIKGTNLDEDVYSKAFGTTASAKYTGSEGYEEIDPLENIPGNVTSIIIDFHTLRTITKLELREIAFDFTGGNLFCIIQLGIGGNWFLPMPVNLLVIQAPASPGVSADSSEAIPAMTAEKLMLTFARVKRTDGSGDVQLNANTGNLYFLWDVTIKEDAATSLVGLSIHCRDFFSDFSIRLGENPPLFHQQDVFFVPGKKHTLPDFSEQINRYTKNMAALVPFTFHTERSGVLEIENLDLDYLRHYRSPPETLTFEPDPQRSGTIERDLEVNIEDVLRIEFISMKLEGEFSAQRILKDIQPFISPEANSTLGFQIVADKKAAQKIKLSDTFKIKGIDLPVKFIDKEVTYTVEIRNDANNRPGEKILVSKKMKVEIQAADENTPSLAKDFPWTPVDFQEEIELTKGTYWLVLEGIAGELVWQIAGQTGAGLTNFLYAYKGENSKWTSLAHSYEKEVCAVYRLRHIPLQFDNPPVLQIKLNNENVWKLARDFESIDILVEEEVNISMNDVPGDSPYVSLAFEAQSVGTLKISDLLVKYGEVPVKRIQINGFVETQG